MGEFTPNAATVDVVQLGTTPAIPVAADHDGVNAVAPGANPEPPDDVKIAAETGAVATEHWEAELLAQSNV